MISPERARALAERWIKAWNTRDLASILALYNHDFAMTSPHIPDLAGEASGRLVGKDAIGAYWRRALDRFPGLHFELERVYAGMNSLVITYRSADARLVAEAMQIDDDNLIVAAWAHHGVG